MKHFVSAMLILSLCTPAIGARQGTAQRQPSPEEMREHAAERVQEMRERLELTEDQEAQMRPILAEAGEEMRELRERYRNEERSRATMDSMREEVERIQQRTREQLQPILSEEQLAEYDKLQKEWRKERQKQRGHGGQRPPRS